MSLRIMRCNLKWSNNQDCFAKDRNDINLSIKACRVGLITYNKHYFKNRHLLC